MASLFVGTNSNIDYSLIDGRIRSLVLNGEILYDEQDGTNTPFWISRLMDFIRDHELDVSEYAFVHWLQEKGLLFTSADNLKLNQEEK